MIQDFKCPSNGGPPDDDSSADLTIRCPFCGNMVVVPEELRRGASPVSSPSGSAMRALGDLKEFGEMVRLVQSGNKIEAIKLYRQIADVGLKDAKDAIDAIAAGHVAKVANYTLRLSRPVTPLFSPVRAEQIAEIVRLLKSDNKIEAIKVYRKTFDVGLREAKDAIDKLETAVDTPGALDRHPPEVPPIAYKTTRTTKRTITDIRLSRFSSWGWIVGLAVIAVAVILLWSAFSAHKGDNRFAAFIRRLSPPTSTLTPTATPFPASTHVPTPIPVPTPTPRFFEPRILVGCTGPQRGCFESARSIGVDGAGNIYVGDLSEFKGGRVEVFDPTGEFIAEWTIGDKDTDLDRIAVDRQGTVYVVSDGNIYRYEGATAKPLGQIEYSGGQGFQDVAVTTDGGLVASWNRDWQGGLFANFESQDDIVVFDSAGKVVNVFGKALSEIAGGDAELDTVITVDRQGNIYANGSLNPGIYKFTPDGKFVGKFGESQVDEALSLAVDAQGRMYASCHSDILIFAPDGRYIELEDWSPEDMVFNDQNELIILRDTEVIKFVLNR